MDCSRNYLFYEFIRSKQEDLLGPFFFVKIFIKSRNIFVDKRICTMIHLVHTKDIRK
jgi:hypothetical protein